MRKPKHIEQKCAVFAPFTAKSGINIAMRSQIGDEFAHCFDLADFFLEGFACEFATHFNGHNQSYLGVNFGAFIGKLPGSIHREGTPRL